MMCTALSKNWALFKTGAVECSRSKVTKVTVHVYFSSTLNLFKSICLFRFSYLFEFTFKLFKRLVSSFVTPKLLQEPTLTMLKTGTDNGGNGRPLFVWKKAAG